VPLSLKWGDVLKLKFKSLFKAGSLLDNTSTNY
jgi:hypothetical protein